MAVKVQQVFNKKNKMKEKKQNKPFFNVIKPFFNVIKPFFTSMASLFA